MSTISPDDTEDSNEHGGQKVSEETIDTLHAEESKAHAVGRLCGLLGKTKHRTKSH